MYGGYSNIHDLINSGGSFAPVDPRIETMLAPKASPYIPPPPRKEKCKKCKTWSDEGCKQEECFHCEHCFKDVQGTEPASSVAAVDKPKATTISSITPTPPTSPKPRLPKPRRPAPVPKNYDECTKDMCETTGQPCKDLGQATNPKGDKAYVYPSVDGKQPVCFNRNYMNSLDFTKLTEEKKRELSTGQISELARIERIRKERQEAAAEAEAEAEAAAAPAPVAEEVSPAQVTVTESPATVTESPTPEAVTESPATVTESPTPEAVTESPTPEAVTESPATVTESPTPEAVTESPAPIPAAATESPAEVSVAEEPTQVAVTGEVSPAQAAVTEPQVTPAVVQEPVSSETIPVAPFASTSNEPTPDPFQQVDTPPPLKAAAASTGIPAMVGPSVARAFQGMKQMWSTGSPTEAKPSASEIRGAKATKEEFEDARGSLIESLSKDPPGKVKSKEDIGLKEKIDKINQQTELIDQKINEIKNELCSSGETYQFC
mgnify:CR=1 FL=1